jgi:hypothetical protein
MLHSSLFGTKVLQNSEECAERAFYVCFSPTILGRVKEDMSGVACTPTMGKSYNHIQQQMNG